MSKRGTSSQENAASGAPYVDPGVSPEAAAYAAGAKARMATRVQKYSAQVGGAPVNIPRLDQAHQTDLTMQQQAAQQEELIRRVQMQASAQQQGQDPSSIVDGMPSPAQFSGGGGVPTPASLGIVPIDVLPDEARKDPEFIDGQGAMVAVAQPKMAMKYGVVRNGQFIPPQKLSNNPDQAKLRPETLKDLETLAKLQQQGSASSKVGGLHSSDEEAEQAAKDSPAAASARIGNMPGDQSSDALTDGERENLNKRLDNLDEFDLDTFKQQMMRDILNNPDQKDLVEKRLEELDIEDLILHNRVNQRVPIVPGRFEPTFQSMTGEEDLAVKRLIMSESKSVEVSDRYLLDKFALMSLAIGLKEINGKPMGEHTDENGSFDDDKFWGKFRRVLRLPLHMLASIGVHHFWFEARVRKLFVAEKVGNG